MAEREFGYLRYLLGLVNTRGYVPPRGAIVR